MDRTLDFASSLLVLFLRTPLDEVATSISWDRLGLINWHAYFLQGTGKYIVTSRTGI